MGHFDKALVSYQGFMDKAIRQFGEYRREVCRAAATIGSIWLEKGDFANAIKSFQQSVRIGSLVLGPDHPDIGIVMNQLGMAHFKAGDLDAALQTYHQALKLEFHILRRTGTNPSLCATYTRIAEIYSEKSDYDQALHFYDELLTFQMEGSFETEEIANTLVHIGTSIQ